MKKTFDVFCKIRQDYMYILFCGGTLEDELGYLASFLFSVPLLSI